MASRCRTNSLRPNRSHTKTRRENSYTVEAEHQAPRRGRGVPRTGRGSAAGVLHFNILQTGAAPDALQRQQTCQGGLGDPHLGPSLPTEMKRMLSVRTSGRRMSPEGGQAESSQSKITGHRRSRWASRREASSPWGLPGSRCGYVSKWKTLAEWLMEFGCPRN